MKICEHVIIVNAAILQLWVEGGNVLVRNNVNTDISTLFSFSSVHCLSKERTRETWYSWSMVLNPWLRSTLPSSSTLLSLPFMEWMWDHMQHKSRWCKWVASPGVTSIWIHSIRSSRCLMLWIRSRMSVVHGMLARPWASWDKRCLNQTRALGLVYQRYVALSYKLYNSQKKEIITIVLLHSHCFSIFTFVSIQYMIPIIHLRCENIWHQSNRWSRCNWFAKRAFK